MRRQNRGKARRGVLLLLILGLLALFGLVAIAFVVITGHGRESALVNERLGQYTHSPEQELKQAMMQVVRGTENAASVLQHHSLLEDVYGNNTVSGTMKHDPNGVERAVAVCNGQLIEFTTDIPQAEGRVGSVLTMVNGPAAGHSARVVGCGPHPAPGINVLQIKAFEDVPTWKLLNAYLHLNPSNTCDYVINGAPFGGTGFGFNPLSTNTNGLLDAKDGEDWDGDGNFDKDEDTNGNGRLDPGEDLDGDGRLDRDEDLNGNGTFDEPGPPYALLPNPTFLRPKWAYGDLAGPGGANEDYDAVDFQNMLLAMQLPDEDVNGNGQLDVGEDLDGDGTLDRGGDVPIPSLHRPALVNYWYHRMVSDLPWPAAVPDPLKRWRVILQPWGPDWDPKTRADNNADTADLETFVWDYVLPLKRKIFLRPLDEDHPDFDGSNPSWRLNADISRWNLTRLSGWYRDRQENPNSPWFRPWDVDNDGDGKADSIWVDLGLPVRSMPDGRRCKPLFAVLCVDLDGRLNLNAHGCGPQTVDAYYQQITAPSYTGDAYFAGEARSQSLPRGQGYGPAEVNLRALFLNDGDLADYDRLLYGNGTIDGRYGETGGTRRPGIAALDDPLSQNKLFDDWSTYSQDYYIWKLGLTSAWTYAYWDFLTRPATEYAPNAFGTPPDLNGDGAIGLDVRGQPLFPAMAEKDEHVDDPYELNLSPKGPRALRAGATDNPFTVAELERLLRPYDVDVALLPDRIRKLAPGLVDRRHEVTTESWHVPSPSGLLTRQLRESLRTAFNSLDPAVQTKLNDEHMLANNGAYTLRDLLVVRLAKGLSDAGVAAADIPGSIRGQFPKLLPLEVLSGLPMDLNRPFGNGLDDNANGVVDEPARIRRGPASSADPNLRPFMLSPAGEIRLAGQPPRDQERVPRVDAAGNPVNSITFHHTNRIDVDGNGTLNNVDRALARQLYARHLYVMMRLVVDFDHLKSEMSGTDEEREKAAARLIAQWAVNVVDFRDRDSIMTPFEYDIHPFKNDDYNSSTGDDPIPGCWDVDGVVEEAAVWGLPNRNSLTPPFDDDKTDYRGLVWGCERPELLITETLAFHDRRTEDLDSGDDFHNNPNSTQDPHFDSKKRPKGALFVELYNPWARREPKTGELYSSYDGGVHLNRMAGKSPVWRLTVRKPTAQPSDLPERSVYFVDAAEHENDPNRNMIDIPPAKDGLQHYPSNPANTLVFPGRYAVIGPGDLDQDTGEQTKTYLGLRQGGAAAAGDSQTRRLELFPGVAGDFDVFYNREGGGKGDLERLGVDDNKIKVPAALAIDMANVAPGKNQHTIVNQYNRSHLRLSVSEPFGGYPKKDLNTVDYDPVTQEYLTAFPDPLDLDNKVADWNRVLVTNGTALNFRVVYLERLANPMVPWDEQSNPYVKIDAMQVDLTTFNGVPEERGHSGPEEGDPDAEFTEGFYSRERGEHNDPADNNLWTQEPRVLTNPEKPVRNENPFPRSIAQHKYTEGLHHTLGYLNWEFGAGDPNGPRDDTLGNEYVGDPRGTPFPWLVWNNRPFVSGLELLDVPAVGPERLLAYPPGTRTRLDNMYGLVPQLVKPYSKDVDNHPFPHLLSFFESDNADGKQSSQFHRLLAFVGVPSRFVGTELQANPATFGGSTAHRFNPPFEHIPSYREPGRVNLNTIFSGQVWKGLMNFFPDMSTGNNWQWDEFRTSRRGGSNKDSFVKIDDDFPTRVESPFRSAGGGYMVPPLDSGQKLTPSREVDATLLRNEDPSGSAESPLFEYSSSLAYNSTNRNPYFRYQVLQRLGNLATTRSNVYAVWITVGYFEVVDPPVSDPAVYPDGFALGAELGTDTGDIKRHRAFFIYDRSIPVGFQRGRDLNAERGLLLSRFIE